MRPGSTTRPKHLIEMNSKKPAIRFEDAVNVIRSLQQGSPSMDARLNQDDVEKIVPRALIASARGSTSSKSNTQKKRQDARSLLSRDTDRDQGLMKPHPRKCKKRNKREDFCRVCGSRKHNRADEPCENHSYMKIRIRERWRKSENRPQQEPEKKTEKNDSPRGMFFRRGSGNRKVKLPDFEPYRTLILCRRTRILSSTLDVLKTSVASNLLWQCTTPSAFISISSHSAAIHSTMAIA